MKFSKHVPSSSFFAPHGWETELNSKIYRSKDEFTYNINILGLFSKFSVLINILSANHSRGTRATRGTLYKQVV